MAARPASYPVPVTIRKRSEKARGRNYCQIIATRLFFFFVNLFRNLRLRLVVLYEALPVTAFLYLVDYFLVHSGVST